MADGKPGAPFGNRNHTKGKPWTEALNRALAQFEDLTLNVKAGEALHRLAWETVKSALEGCKDARREIAERQEGKVPLPIEGSMTNENFVYLISDRPKSADEWQRKYGDGMGAPAGTANSIN